MLLRSMVFEIFYGCYGTHLFQQTFFEKILSFTGVEPGFVADPANTYPDLPFELLKLDLCAYALIGRK